VIKTLYFGVMVNFSVTVLHSKLSLHNNGLCAPASGLLELADLSIYLIRHWVSVILWSPYGI